MNEGQRMTEATPPKPNPGLFKRNPPIAGEAEATAWGVGLGEGCVELFPSGLPPENAVLNFPLNRIAIG